jgi:hypothetical protein
LFFALKKKYFKMKVFTIGILAIAAFAAATPVPDGDVPPLKGKSNRYPHS